MRIQHSAQRHISAICTSLAILLSSLAGCASSTTPTITPPPATAPTSFPTSLVVQPAFDPAPTASSGLPAQMAKAQQIMAGMSLEQKLGQLLVVEYIGNSYQRSDLQYMIKQQFVGGFIYQPINHNFDPPYNTVSNLSDFSRRAMQDARIPLIIATDQEGGLVSRLRTFHGDLPSAQAIAATGDPHFALAQGTQDAKWMVELGMNVDLAPVVDVQTVDPPVLFSRMFGHDPQTVVAYAGAFLTGLQNNGIAGCLKHFPGLGAITSDPHVGLPTVTRSMTNLENIDLAPYKLMISKYHPAMIMATDVLTTAIDPTLPAELSPKAINGVLRGQLGYNGVVITDGIHMGGINNTWTVSQAAVLAIIAGDDIVEAPNSPAEVASVITGFKQAIQQGRLTTDRINQSVERILLMKIQRGIIRS